MPSRRNQHHQRVAESLTGSLADGLTHPGNGKSGPVAVVLPGFRTGGGMPEELVAAVRSNAKPVAEAIVHTITEVAGNTIVPTGEYQQLVAIKAQHEAEAPERKRVALTIMCAACQTVLFTLPPMYLDEPRMIPLSLKHLKEQLARIPEECNHQPARTA
jgi:hypothetical protein